MRKARTAGLVAASFHARPTGRSIRGPRELDQGEAVVVADRSRDDGDAEVDGGELEERVLTSEAIAIERT